jgi:phage/plasmid-associated DNA primase
LQESLCNPSYVKVQATRLFLAYQQWCKTAGEAIPTRRQFIDRMEELGHVKKPSTGGHNYWQGINLLPSSDPENEGDDDVPF